MDPRAFAAKPTLEGERVVLRPLIESDAEEMAAILADPELQRLTGSARSTAQSEAVAAPADEPLRRWYRTRGEQADRLDLGVVDRASGRLVGEVVLNDLRADDETCNLRIALGPGGRDQGLGTEAVRLIVDHTFTTTAVYRIELEVYAFNGRARHVYRNLGFRTEGVRRAALLFDGERADSIVMALLRPDWEVTKLQSDAKPERRPATFSGGADSVLALVVDCSDLERATAFWSRALGYHRDTPSAHAVPYLALLPDRGDGPELLLQRVPERKVAENRVHVDLRVRRLAPEVARLRKLGARQLTTAPIRESGWTWHVLADPDGNEFCVLQPPDAYWSEDVVLTPR